MRILYLSASAALGGAERVLLDLLAGVQQLRPTWCLDVCVPGDGALADRLREHGAGVTIVEMPPRLRTAGVYGAGAPSLAMMPALWRYARDLRQAIRHLAPSLVHSNGLKMHTLAAWARPRGTPLVWHLHDYVSRRRSAVHLLRPAANSVQAIVGNSASVTEDARRALNARVGAQAILNGVNERAFTPEGAKADLDALALRPAPPEGTLRVGLVGTYARWKGHATFLEALAVLPKELPVRAYIVGGPIYETGGSQVDRAELEAAARRVGVSDHVAFVPFTEDTPSIYRALDVVVHASTEPEPFGLVVAEAMACGRAVVAARAGGVEEVLQEGVNGLWHEPGNGADLASTMARLVQSPELRARLGAQARRTAETHLTATRVAREFTELYEQLAEASPVEASA